MKILNLAALVLACLPMGTAQANSVSLTYHPVAATADGVWADYGVDPGTVEVLEARNGPFLVSVLTGPAWCSVNACPVRVFDEGRQVLYVEACTNTGTHAIDPAKRLFVACGESSRLD